MIDTYSSLDIRKLSVATLDMCKGKFEDNFFYTKNMVATKVTKLNDAKNGKQPKTRLKRKGKVVCLLKGKFV